jgi:hypothetical protein
MSVPYTKSMAQRLPVTGLPGLSSGTCTVATVVPPAIHRRLIMIKGKVSVDAITIRISQMIASQI